jgi:uncharacterized protein
MSKKSKQRRKEEREQRNKDNEVKKLKEYKFSSFAQTLIDKNDARRNAPNRFKNFKMPEPISPKMAMDGESKMTNDSLPINGVNFRTFDKINNTLLNSWFLGYQEYSLLSQNGIIQNIIQTFAQESVREWVEIKSISKDKKDNTDKIRKINDRFEELKVRAKFKHAMEQTIMFGGCKIYPKIKGDDSTEGGNELEMPFYKEKMGKGDLLYLKVIEPLYVTPLEFNASNPLKEDYYVPKTYSVLSQITHQSRLCHFVYNEVPTLLKPVYWFNGFPLVQLCLDYIMGFESVRQNVVGVTGRYNINVFKTNMNALLYEGETFDDSTYKRLQIAQELQSNFSIFAMNNDPANPEEWQQFNMTIAGLDTLLNQNAELVCAVARIPAIKLFGTNPKGFNATGDTELRIFYDLIRSMQTSILLPNLQFIFELVQIDLFGEIDRDLQIEFKPLWSENALEKADIQLKKSQVNLSYFGGGILTAEEIRQSLNFDKDSGFSDLAEDFEEVDEDEASDEESQQETENYETE